MQRNRKKTIGLLLCLGAVVIVATGWRARSIGETSTDNAYVRGDVTSLAPKVAGYVTTLEVEDNQTVQAGDVLFRIDDRDYRAKLAQAVANVEAAQARLTNVDADIQLQHALVRQAEAQRRSTVAEKNLATKASDRRRELIRTNAVSQAAVDESDAALSRAEAGVSAASAMVEAQQQRIAVLATQREAAVAAVAQAQAARDLAQIDLDNTVVHAPVERRLPLSARRGRRRRDRARRGGAGRRTRRCRRRASGSSATPRCRRSGRRSTRERPGHRRDRARRRGVDAHGPAEGAARLARLDARAPRRRPRRARRRRAGRRRPGGRSGAAAAAGRDGDRRRRAGRARPAAGDRGRSAGVGDRAQVVFVTGVDAPLLHPALIRHVIAALRPGDDVALPEAHGFPHPLAAAYRAATVAPLVDELLAEDSLGTRPLMRRARVRRLDEAALLADPAVAAHDPQLRLAAQPQRARRVRGRARTLAEPLVERRGGGTLRAATLARAGGGPAQINGRPRAIRRSRSRKATIVRPAGVIGAEQRVASPHEAPRSSSPPPCRCS